MSRPKMIRNLYKLMKAKGRTQELLYSLTGGYLSKMNNKEWMETFITDHKYVYLNNDGRSHVGVIRMMRYKGTHDGEE